MEADIAGQLSPIKHNQWYEVTASAASDWLRDISGWKWYLSTNQKQGWQSLHKHHFW